MMLLNGHGHPDKTDVIIFYLNAVREREQSFFKIRAYENAIKSIKNLKNPIYNIKDVENVKGIGRSIKTKIQEILDTGKLVSFDFININAQDNEQVEKQKLSKVYGIGPNKARDLYSKGITLENLGKHLQLLSRVQKIGFALYNDFEQPIPISEMREHEKIIRNICGDISSNIVIEIAGSYRRKRDFSGDIDVLVSTSKAKDYETIIKKMKNDMYLTHIFAFGSKKMMGSCKIGKSPQRRIDVMFSSPENYPFALLYFTGNSEFNVKMRNIALQMGYRLSEHGLKKNNKDIIRKFKTEKDIFNFLGLKFVPPEKRSPENVVYMH